MYALPVKEDARPKLASVSQVRWCKQASDDQRRGLTSPICLLITLTLDTPPQPKTVGSASGSTPLLVPSLITSGPCNRSASASCSRLSRQSRFVPPIEKVIVL